MKMIQSALLGVNIAALIYSNLFPLWVKLNIIGFILGWTITIFSHIFLEDEKSKYLEAYAKSRGHGTVNLQSVPCQIATIVAGLLFLITMLSTVVYSIFWIINV